MNDVLTAVNYALTFGGAVPSIVGAALIVGVVVGLGLLVARWASR